MSALSAASFPDFFHSLHGYQPYPWQCDLAEQAVTGCWPEAIDLPTGSGKTACLDIAIFALACQAALPVAERSAPRRIFFCVNRRVIVDEAHHRARQIALKLAAAEQDGASGSVLAEVAAALRKISTLAPGSAPPLDVLELRGGIYRDNRWARSVTQPTIVCTTLDQLGSRLLFRGYGISPQAAPIHAALIAYDSLVLLDEAHISRPFWQTLDFVSHYLKPEWAEQALPTRPLQVVKMTATPPATLDNVFRLSPRDCAQPGLKQRLTASKPATLKAVPDLVAAAVKEAQTLVSEPRAIGIIVNRVSTARAIYTRLQDAFAASPEIALELVIGSMRPLDRNRQAARLQPLVGAHRPPQSLQSSIIVSTQCLEVGADYDFDALITECASLDALRQRFGRLNRAGRPVASQAFILAEENFLKQAKPRDPVYGNALSLTWHWLQHNAQIVGDLRVKPLAKSAKASRSSGKDKSAKGSALAGVAPRQIVDFGVDEFNRLLDQQGSGGQIPPELLAPSASLEAPVMLPAYLDCWCQTSSPPVPDPEVALFIHGLQSSEPDVQVCWRADLVADQSRDWCDIVSLLPPTSAECMTVPISRVRRWLQESSTPGEAEASASVASDADSDLLSGDFTAAKQEGKTREVATLEVSLSAVIWRGPEHSCLLVSPGDLRPGDTLVVPAGHAGWEALGHIPPVPGGPGAHPVPCGPGALPTLDIAEAAFREARDRAAWRLHPSLGQLYPNSPALGDLLGSLVDPDFAPTPAELSKRLARVAEEVSSENQDLQTTLRDLTAPRNGMVVQLYPDGKGVVLSTRRRLATSHLWSPPPSDEGDNLKSLTTRRQGVGLPDHTGHVLDEVMRTVHALPQPNLEPAYHLVAQRHDGGKADPRFQAMLRRSDLTDAWLLTGRQGALLAKSDSTPLTRQQINQACRRAGLPPGFRHEMLSMQLAEANAIDHLGVADADLALHLIAAHHGYARPWAPLVLDPDPPEVALDGVTLTRQHRLASPPHRIDSGLAERFWRLTERYGWWGLAYLEAIFRLADQQASADEDEPAAELPGGGE